MPKRFSIHGSMICASEQAENRKYKMLVGKSGRRWMVAVQPNEADNIYVEGGKNSDGFGGRSIDFDVENGETIPLKGPWKTCADGLLKDTGYDATKTYTSRGIVAFNRVVDGFNGDFYVGLLHCDDDVVIGTFDRIEDLAQEYATKFGQRIYYGVKTYGGGSAGWRDPTSASAEAA